MGIPKFFRWMSERYPMCSQLIQENSIPEFDNLYLDMNGIVHNSSHNNNESAHFRITEDQIWIGIFNYIEHVFNKIKPKKLFFLAIDGVAPRAKMNQQRSRRFRTAMDAENTRKEALRKGEDLPAEAPFDSNCITPGTEFMRKLSLHLRYFIAKKVSEDADWRGVEIVLSGPEVPGEGEHKIMEYIRLARTQETYNPNTRHCLYGLDADLVMLGLLSHDPHFALLREEVTFGKQSKKKTTSLDAQRFYLMHLSLLREYLDMEFDALKPVLKSDYDLERVIDDFILLALFVGNDFLPHLPHVHIHEGALGLMFEIYKKVRPTCAGYIQDGGTVDLETLQKVLFELAESVEKDAFEAEVADLAYLSTKRDTALADQEMMRNVERKKKKDFTMTSKEKGLFEQTKEFVLNRKPGEMKRLDFSSTCNARERKFIETLARKLGLCYAIEHSGNTKHMYIEFMENEEGTEEETSESEESIAAIQRVLDKYQNAKMVEEVSREEQARLEKEAYDASLKQWKADYYKDKMNIDIDNADQMEHLVKSYINGIQWVLHYYYNGVKAWGWFYPYHYAPRISDLINIIRFKDPGFELGKPFQPHEQLMGVLPSLSRKLLPYAYQDLMTEITSPIIDFYPTDFKMDMNGKKQDWEAVVKIPFIDEKRLLDAMKTREHRLTKEERNTSIFGQCYTFIYDQKLAAATGNQHVYKSTLPHIFPDILHCCAKEAQFHLPTLEGGQELKKHLLKGTFLGKDALAGFPSLNTISHRHNVEKLEVNVFQQPSKNDTVAVYLTPDELECQDLASLAEKYIQKRVYVGYPFLSEAIVMAVSNEDETLEFAKVRMNRQTKMREVITRKIVHTDDERKRWCREVGTAEGMSRSRYGLLIGETEYAFHTCVIRGMREERGALLKEYVSPERAEITPVQTIVFDVKHEDHRYKERKRLPLIEEFPVNSSVFFIPDRESSAFCYGACAKVEECNDETDTLTISFIIPADREKAMEPTFGYAAVKSQEGELQYTHHKDVAKKLGMNPRHLAKLTSSLQVKVDNGPMSRKLDLGLRLKFEKKELMVPNYTRKNARGDWEYSALAIELIGDYLEKYGSHLDTLLKHSGDGMPKIGDLKWGTDGQQIAKEIVSWLKEKKVDTLPQLPLDSQMLDAKFVQEMQEKATKYHDEYEALLDDETLTSTLKINNVPRESVMKPSFAEFTLHAQQFNLGDRVVYCLETGAVPLGTRGTVVSILGKIVDVLFDVPVRGCTSLDGRCSEFRGLALSVNHILKKKTMLHHHKENHVNHHHRESQSNHHHREAQSNHHHRESQTNHHHRDSQANNHHYREAQANNHHYREAQGNHHYREAQSNHHSREVQGDQHFRDTQANGSATPVKILKQHRPRNK